MNGSDWQKITAWSHDAKEFLNGPDGKLAVNARRNLVNHIDADPRNAEWLGIVRVYRLTGYRIPGWAALWLGWLAHKRGSVFWSQVARAAREVGITPVPPEGR